MSKPSSPVRWSAFTLIKKVNDWWTAHSDAYLRELPLFQSPIYFVSLLLTCCSIILVSEVYLKKRKNIIARLSKSAAKSLPAYPIKDHRPITLIHNGFCFGVYGVALLLLITVTYYGKLLFSCDPAVKMTEFHQNSIKHTLYTYLIMTFPALLDPLVRVLAGAKIDHTIDILHHLIWSIILTAYTTVNPIGITMALLVIDSIHNVIKYGSAVLSINVPEDKKNNYHKVAEVIRITVFSIISAHVYQVTHLIKGNKCRPPIAGKGNHVYDPAFLFPVTVYAAIVIAVSIIRLAALFLTPDVIGKQQVAAAGVVGAKTGGDPAAAAAGTAVNGKNLRKSIRLSKTSTSTSSL